MTKDRQWTAFLRWALPQLRRRWSGFRKARTKVRKRVHKRLQSLQLVGLNDYRVHGELPVTRRLRPESLLDSAFCGRTSGLQGGRSVNLC